MKPDHILKISGLALGISSFVLLTLGIVFINIAKKCDPNQMTFAECQKFQSMRRNGTILIVVGGIGVVVAGVAIMWKRIFKESALVSAVAAVSAAVAAFAAASAASAAATASEHSRYTNNGAVSGPSYIQQIPPSPTLIANAENVYDAVKNLRR